MFANTTSLAAFASIMRPLLAGRTGPLIVLASFLLAMTPAAAEESSGAEAETPRPVGSESCLGLSRIRSTRIIDDSTILFYLRTGETYVNRLPRRCPGLRSAGSFGYKTSLTSLCNVDIITVLQPGTAMMRGASCGLGFFLPITADEIEILRGEGKLEPEADPVKPEIETPAEETAGEPEGATEP